MVLDKLPLLGRPTTWMTVGQGPVRLAVRAGGGCLEFLLSYILSLLFLSLWETVRSKQPTNQPILVSTTKIKLYRDGIHGRRGHTLKRSHLAKVNKADGLRLLYGMVLVEAVLGHRAPPYLGQNIKKTKPICLILH